MVIVKGGSSGVSAGNKFYLNKPTNTDYLVKNASSGKVELWINGSLASYWP